jgi:hypothetical protein
MRTANSVSNVNILGLCADLLARHPFASRTSMSTVKTPGVSKEKERISSTAHADCTKVLNALLAHEAIQKITLTAEAKAGLLDGTFSKMDSVPIELKTKLSKKSMGLLKVQQLLGSKQSRCRFKTCEKFAKDVRLVFQNVLSLHNYWKERQSSNYDAILYHTTQKLLQVCQYFYSHYLSYAGFRTNVLRATSSSYEPTQCFS